MERAARGDVNATPRSHAAEYRDIVVRNVFTLLNLIIIPAAITLFFLEEKPRGAIAISGMALVNTLMGLVQEIRAKRHLDKLAILTETKAKVLRDGQVQEIPASAVVKDDLLMLVTGGSVVADGTVVAARSLEVDEALLTGESDPLPRQPGEAVLSGSFCVTGEGVYRADKVGKNAYAQALSAEARRYRHEASPLQKDIRFLIRWLTVLALVLCVSYVPLVPPTNKEGLEDFAGMVAATITSMIPQGLVLMATLAFVLGAVRMSKRGAVVQRLNAVETMSAVNVLCLDKTGTLTTNRLKLERIDPLAYDVPEAEIRRRAQLFVSASVDQGNKSIAALKKALGEVATDRLDQLPFKSQNRYSGVRVRDRGNECVFVLGAVEALQPHLSTPAPSLTEAMRELAAHGWRVLLFAEACRVAAWKDGLESLQLRPLALIALSDELRPDAGRVLEEFASQGIDIKIISGDNPDTVRATVRQLSPTLAEPDGVTGPDWEKSQDKAGLAMKAHVFGRISPLQKEQIVEMLQKQGRTVAMIGDGVNDVLPIKKAQLGIAMGEGSQATKTVASLVLATNDFALLPEILAEGRLILRNLRRAGKVFLVKNVYTLLLIIIAVIVCQLPFPYKPQQVTLLNAFTIGLPALFMATSRGRAAAHQGSWLREVGFFAIRTGGIVGVVCLILYVLAVWNHDPESLVPRTWTLTMLIVLGQLLMLRALTDQEPHGQKLEAKFILLAGFSLAAYVAILYMPATQDFFALAPLQWWHWIVVICATTLAAGALWAWELTGWMARRKSATD
jgi:cation-transporting P-type ATPase E